MNTETRTVEIIAGFLGAETDVDPQTDLFKETSADSLDFVEIVLLLEDEFGVDLHDCEWAYKGTTPRFLAEEIDRRKNPRAA